MSGTASDAAESDDFQDYAEQQQLYPQRGALASAAAAPPAPVSIPRATVRAPAQPAFNADPSGFQADPNQPAYAGQEAVPQRGAVSQFGSEMWASVTQQGADLLGAATAATRALNADPDVAAYVAQQQQSVAAYTAKVISRLSPDAQKAMHASLFASGSDPNAPSPGQAGWGNYAGATIAGLIPTLAMAVVPGSIASRVAAKLATTVGAAADVAGTVGKVANVATTAGMFGAQDAGAAYNEFTHAIDTSTPQELSKSPTYQQAISQGMSDVDARKQMVATLAPAFMAERFTAGAVAGAAPASILLKGAVGSVASTAGRAALGAAEGGVAMGGQNLADTAAQQQLEQQTGQRQGFDPHALAMAFAQGALGGAVLGGVGGTIHGGEPVKSTPAAATTPTVSGDTGSTTTTPDVGPTAPKPSTVSGGGEAPPTPNAAAGGEGGSPPPAPPAGSQPARSPGNYTGKLAPVTWAEPGGAAGLADAIRTSKAASDKRAAEDGTTPPPAAAAPDVPADQAAAMSAATPPATPAAPAGPVTTSQVQRRDGVGFNEAQRRAQAENAAAQAAPPAEPTTSASPDGAGSPVAAVPEASPPGPEAATAAPETPPAASAAPAETPPAAPPAAPPAGPPIERNEPAPALAAPPKPAATVAEAAAQTQEPTPAAAISGKYPKGRVNIGGLPVSIETAMGQERKGVGPDGKPWSVTMPAHYGEVERTTGADGDPIDVYLGPQADQAAQHPVYVVDQIDPKTKLFDEHKGMVGFDSPEAATQAYDASFSDGSGPTRRGAVTEMPFDAFKQWAQKGDTKKPITYQPDRGAQFRAKRAAEKARMAGGVEVKQQKGAVEQGEGAPGEPAPAKAQAAAFDRDAAGGAIAREVVPLRKGADTTAATQKILDSIEQHLNGEPPSMVALKEWAKSQPDRFPGTKTRPAEIADRISRKLTGEGIVEGRGARADILSQDVKNDQGRGAGEMASDTDHGTAVEERGAAPDLTGEGPAEEVRDGKDASQIGRGAVADEPTEEAGPKVTTDYKTEQAAPERAATSAKTRTAADLLNEVANRTKDPIEAAREYGERKEGSAGRPREFKRFIDYVENRIKHYSSAEAAETNRALIKDLTERRDNQAPNSQTRSANTSKINRLHAEAQMFTPEGVRRLFEVHETLSAEQDKISKQAQEDATAKEADEGPIKAEAEKIGVSIATARKLQGLVISLKDRQAVKAILAGDDGRRFGLNARQMEQVTDRLSKVPEKDLDKTMQWLHDTFGGKGDVMGRSRLNEAITDAYVRTVAGSQLSGRIRYAIMRTESADRPGSLRGLLQMVADDPEVRRGATPLAELARRLLSRVPDLQVLTREQAADRGIDYDPDFDGAYYFDPDPASRHVMIDINHPDAIVKTLVHEAIHAATADYVDRISRSGGRAWDAISALTREIQRQLPAVTDTRAADAGAYAISSPHELATMVLTDPRLQAIMARMEPTEGFRAAMEKAGYGMDGVRNVWQAFTGWLRKAFGLPPAMNLGEASVLDYALRPLTDVLENGSTEAQARYDSALSGPAVMGSRAFDRLDDTIRAVARHADVPGVLDKIKRWSLQGATLDGMLRWNKELFTPNDRLGDLDKDGKLVPKANPLEGFRTAQEAKNHVTNTVHKSYSDTANDLARKLADPANAQLGPLMNDATLAEVRLGTTAADANDHLTTVEQQDALKDLQDRYERLSPAQQDLYKQTRDLYDKMYREERTGQMESMIRAVVPDATDAQKEVLTKALRTKKGLDAFLADDENSDVAKAFGSQYQAKRAVVRSIAQLRKSGFVQGDYFPLARYGDYVIRYGEKGQEGYGVERFESRTEAEARRAELAKSDVEDLSQVTSVRDRQFQGRIMPDNALVNDLDRALSSDPDLREHAEQVRDMFNQILLSNASRSELARNRMRRQGVAGAATQPSKTLARAVLAHGYRMGGLAHDLDISKSMADMELVARDLERNGQKGQGITARSIVSELQSRLGPDDANSSIAGVARKATSLGYVQSLMSFSHMLTSTVESHMNGQALLGARHGHGRAALAVSRAMAQLGPVMTRVGARTTFQAMAKGLQAADWNMARYARDTLISKGADRAHMTALFEGLDRAGLIDHTQDREIRRIANPTGISATKLGTSWQRFMDFTGAGAHAVDVMNKSAIAKAAFDLSMRDTGDVGRAVANAIDMARQVSPNYNLSNKARISTGKGSLGFLAPPLTQFKQYGLHMYSVMGNLAKASMHGASAAEKSEARKALAGVLVTHAAMAGALTLIADPLRYAGGAYDYFTGAQTPHDYENDVRGWMSDTFGPEVGEVLARGLPHLAGFDIHQRVGLSNLLEMPELNSFDKKGVMTMLASALTGAAGEDAASMAGGFNKLVNGDIAGGAAALVPRNIRDVLAADKLANQGLTDSRGKTIIPADKISPLDVGYRALGFQPSDVSEAHEGREAVYEAENEAKQAHTQLTQAWIAADPVDKAAIMSQIQQFNMANPGMRITVQQMIKTMTAQRKAQGTTVAGSFGLTLPKKAAQTYIQAGRFANVGQ